VIPILAGSHGETLGWAPLYALMKAAVAFAITWSVGQWVLRPLFHEVTGSRAPDLFTLTVLLVSLAAAWVTSLLGLSLALGAFLAGAMLGETEFRHPIEADIRPFRDVLLGLFFVTVGMQLTIDLITPVWPWVLLVTSGLVLGKGLAVAMLTRLTGYDQSTALRTGMLLGQGGEFGIALLTVALGTGLLSAQSIQPVLAAIVLSMALAPLLIRHNGRLASRLLKHRGRGAKARREHEIAEAVKGSMAT
jgi:CPA2 family monovalent cation:H+ antiporter-2